MPLPPYIKEELQDQERYQTVYSKVNGSAAAPTAGLHFTPELLNRVQEAGVKVGYVTLHVGLGTFRPVKEEEITDHAMHSEYCVIPQETAELINGTRQKGGRVICVGTTSCRTLDVYKRQVPASAASAHSWPWRSRMAQGSPRTRQTPWRCRCPDWTGYACSPPVP